MAETLSVAEAKELIRLCRAGRLYEVEAWIRAGRSLDVPREMRTTPLRVALETGFHSLIELLLRHEASQQVKNDLLGNLASDGVSLRPAPLARTVVLFLPWWL